MAKINVLEKAIADHTLQDVDYNLRHGQGEQGRCEGGGYLWQRHHDDCWGECRREEMMTKTGVLECGRVAQLRGLDGKAK